MPKSLNELLDSVLQRAGGKAITIGEIISVLKHRGLAILVVIFSAPFLFPFQVPGLSIPFGIALIFVGLQMGCPDRQVFPKKIMGKKIAYKALEKWIHRTKWILNKVNKFVYHRMGYFVLNKWVVTINGLFVAAFSVIFILPIPLPFTNFLAAIPIFMVGLGTLEEDGLVILLSYLFGIACFAGVVAIIWYGFETIEAFSLDYF